MQRQLQITLPEETVQLLERWIDDSSKGPRDHLIDKAIRLYITRKQPENLAQKLKQGAIARAERDLNLARDWFPLEEELWKKHDGIEKTEFIIEY